jgi:hypothetical protein
MALRDILVSLDGTAAGDGRLELRLRLYIRTPYQIRAMVLA